MTSLARKLQRSIDRKTGKVREVRDRPSEPLADGGYRWLHPTSGWKIISGRRLAAQGRMAQILGGR